MHPIHTVWKVWRVAGMESLLSHASKINRFIHDADVLSTVYIKSNQSKSEHEIPGNKTKTLDHDLTLIL
jgi:hypothetical protein